MTAGTRDGAIGCRDTSWRFKPWRCFANPSGGQRRGLGSPYAAGGLQAVCRSLNPSRPDTDDANHTKAVLLGLGMNKEPMLALYMLVLGCLRALYLRATAPTF